MQALSPAAENFQDTVATLAGRISHLEDSLIALGPIFCQHYGEIDFTALPQETFETPFSVHDIAIPHTDQNATFITTPARFSIGNPASHTAGPLHWERVLEIQFPKGAKVVSFGYGGGTGTVEWLSDNGAAGTTAALPNPKSDAESAHYFLAEGAGIRSIKITSSGDMYLNNLSVGIA